MSRKHKFREKTRVYFISFTTVYCIDILTRAEYFGNVIESLGYYRKHNSLDITSCLIPFIF